MRGLPLLWQPPAHHYNFCTASRHRVVFASQISTLIPIIDQWINYRNGLDVGIQNSVLADESSGYSPIVSLTEPFGLLFFYPNGASIKRVDRVIRRLSCFRKHRLYHLSKNQWLLPCKLERKTHGSFSKPYHVKAIQIIDPLVNYLNEGGDLRSKVGSPKGFQVSAEGRNRGRLNQRFRRRACGANTTRCLDAVQKL